MRGFAFTLPLRWGRLFLFYATWIHFEMNLIFSLVSTELQLILECSCEVICSYGMAV